MQALVKTQKGSGFIELRDAPEPSPGAGEVLIEVKACGICGTDIHVWHDEFPYWPPVIMGHEFSGEVVAAGPETGLFKVGDRVVGEPHTRACGHCYLCRTGNIQICALKRSPGWGIDGAFTKFLKMPERLLHRIPDSMSYDVAALVEPTANTVHDVVERARVSAGDFVVVLGPGPIGLLAALTARAAGARDVVIVGTPADEAFRLKKARELGFKNVINVAQVNPGDVVRESYRGDGRRSRHRVQRRRGGHLLGRGPHPQKGPHLCDRPDRQGHHPLPLGQSGLQGMRRDLQPFDQLYELGSNHSLDREWPVARRWSDFPPPATEGMEQRF